MRRASVSARGGQARSRAASATSASAVKQRARASVSRGPKPAPRVAQRLPRPPQVPELGHRDPAQRQGRRVVPQGDALERAERIPCAQRALPP